MKNRVLIFMTFLALSFCCFGGETSAVANPPVQERKQQLLADIARRTERKNQTFVAGVVMSALSISLICWVWNFCKDMPVEERKKLLSPWFEFSSAFLTVGSIASFVNVDDDRRKINKDKRELENIS